MNIFSKNPTLTKALLAVLAIVLFISLFYMPAKLNQAMASTETVAYKAGYIAGILIKIAAIVRISWFLINNRKVNIA